MSVEIRCDWCGGTVHIADAFTTLKVARGRMVGHYHELGCWPQMLDAIGMLHELHQVTEQVPTISAQAVAARRRKHHKPDEST
jgi:hypothetical protein